MSEFKSLKPRGLPKDFDAKIQSEEPVVSVKEAKSQIVVSYSFPGFYLSDHVRNVRGKEVTFKQVNIKGTGFISDAGKPLLPSFGRYVQIPRGCSFRVSVKRGKPTVFEDVLVLPSQAQLVDNSQADTFKYNQTFYKKPGAYPKNVVGVRGPLEMDDYAALLLNVSPFQYFPAKKKLVGYGNIAVTIKLKAQKGAVTDTPFDQAANRMAYGNLFVNPVRRIEERVRVPVGRVITPVLRPRGPEFLIIYHETFKRPAQTLAKWKNTRGIRTEIVSIKNVGNTVPKIKAYIRNRRKALFSRLRYVLLFGDTDHIVTQVIHYNASDYYYSTAKNPVGSKYELPWLAIGRIPVRTTAQGNGVVNQIIRYEKTPPTDPDYYDRMALAAFLQDYNDNGWADRAYVQTMEGIRPTMLGLGFNVDRIYVTNSSDPQFYIDGTPIPADVIAAMVPGATATADLVNATSDGQLIIGHRDHGSPDGWSEPSFTRTDLNAVTGNIPTIFYSLNCQTGRFDQPGGTESFAERLLRIDGGAPSLVACTRNSNTWLNNYLMKALFDAMWGSVLPAFPGGSVSYPVRRNRLGDILNYGKTYLPLQVGTYPSVTETTVQDHLEIYHVLGDPTLELWKEEPKKVRIIAYLRIGYLYIRLSHCPVDSVMTIWHRGKLLKRLTPTGTTLKIALKDLVYPTPYRLRYRSDLLVCFSAPGYRFVQTKPRMWGPWPVRPL